LSLSAPRHWVGIVVTMARSPARLSRTREDAGHAAERNNQRCRSSTLHRWVPFPARVSENGGATPSRGLRKVDQERAAARVVEHVVERADEVIDLVLAADKRGEKLHDVHPVARDLGEHAVTGEERADDELGEESLVCRFEESEPRARHRAVGDPKTSPIMRPLPRVA